MGFFDLSFRLYRAWGIDVRVHILFILYAFFQLAQTGANPKAWLLHLLLLFGSVLLHEYGHCVGARLMRGDAHLILLWPLGGLAFQQTPMRAWAQFVMVASGPLVNVLIVLVCFGILIVSGLVEAVRFSPFDQVRVGTWHDVLIQLAGINIALLCFNLLPIYPFDGGQILRALLWPLLGLTRATLIATQVGIGGAVVLGVWGAMESKSMLIALAIMGGLASWQQYVAARSGYLVEDAAVRHVRRPSRPGLWSRLWRRGETPARRPANPNPGKWQEKLDEEHSLQAEVDRILKKFREQGAQSLTYVERQSLERATRELRRREAERERNA